MNRDDSNLEHSEERVNVIVKNKKIVIVHGTLNIGGAERQSLILARYLMRIGAHVEIWGLSTVGDLAKVCEAEGIPWRIQEFSWLSRFSKKVFSFGAFALAIKRGKVDVLLPYTNWPNVLCGLVRKFVQTDVCIWNQRNEGNERVRKFYEKMAVKNTNHFVSNSKNGANFLENEYGIVDISIINNGIEAIDGEEHEKLGDQSNFNACMVANITEKKDHKTLLDAWKIVTSELAKENIDTNLILIGKEYDNGLLRKYVALLRLENNVTFTGFLENVREEICLADIGVFSSIAEGSPNGVLECMAAGLAVCATDIRAIRDLLVAENLPYLSPVSDAEIMAKNILTLAKDRRTREFVGRRNKAIIKDNYSSERMCKEMVRIIANYL